MKKTICFIGLILLATAVAGISVATSKYPGSVGPCVLFNASFVVLVALAIPRPRSYAYGYFSALLALGFAVKFNVHMLLQYDFVEPVGQFDDSAASWDRALILSSAAAWGVCIPRVLQLLFWRRSQAATVENLPVPQWYVDYRRWVWLLTLTAIGVLSICNYHFAFYQIGVTPQLRLPRVMQISSAWLIHVGFALWLAVLVWWERSVRPLNLAVTLLAPLLEGFASAVSALSRSIFLLHTIPYFFVLVKRGGGLRVRTAVKMAVLFVLLFGASIVVVQIDRIRFFSPVAAGFVASEAMAAEAKEGVQKAWAQKNRRQLLKMPVDRWIGLEGVLAVSSASGLGRELFLEALTESPQRGTAALYQQVAKSKYRASEKFVFLTTPGVAGVLAFAGSVLVVLLGLVLVTSLMLGTEMAILQLTRNPLLTSAAALAMANIVQQLQFPYLGFVFFVELWTTIFGIALIARISTPRGRSTAVGDVFHPHGQFQGAGIRRNSAISSR